MGSHVVVLNNNDVAADLLERRSLVYADRVCAHSDIPFMNFLLIKIHCQPRFPMVGELYDFSCSPITARTNQDSFQDMNHLVLLSYALQ